MHCSSWQRLQQRFEASHCLRNDFFRRLRRPRGEISSFCYITAFLSHRENGRKVLIVRGIWSVIGDRQTDRSLLQIIKYPKWIQDMDPIGNLIERLCMEIQILPVKLITSDLGAFDKMQPVTLCIVWNAAKEVNPPPFTWIDTEETLCRSVKETLRIDITVTI